MIIKYDAPIGHSLIIFKYMNALIGAMCSLILLKRSIIFISILLCMIQMRTQFINKYLLGIYLRILHNSAFNGYAQPCFVSLYLLAWLSYILDMAKPKASHSSFLPTEESSLFCSQRRELMHIIIPDIWWYQTVYLSIFKSPSWKTKSKIHSFKMFTKAACVYVAKWV